MKNKKTEEVKKHKSFDKGQIFVKAMAGILVGLTLLAACASLIYALIG